MTYVCQTPWAFFILMIVGFLMMGAGVLAAWEQSGAKRDVRVRWGEISLEGREPLLLLAIGFGIALAPLILVKLCSNTPDPGAVTINNNFAAEQIQVELDRSVRTEDFWITREPGVEAVYGDSGTYYLIDLRDRQADVSIYFDPGRYNKDRLSQAYRDALDSLGARLLQRLDSLAVPYRLYVVGTADTLDAEDPLLGTVLGDLPDHITFLKRNPRRSGQWLPEFQQVLTPRDYDNDDLPNLRGAFLQQLVQGMKCEATLLEGSVIESNDPMDRRALLYLYWPDDAAGGAPPPSDNGDRPCRR